MAPLFSEGRKVCVFGKVGELSARAFYQLRALAPQCAFSARLYDAGAQDAVQIPLDVDVAVFLLEPEEPAVVADRLSPLVAQSLTLVLSDGWEKKLATGFSSLLEVQQANRVDEVLRELARRLYLPCIGFDADKVSRDRISGMIARLQRGDGLPAGWMGWRDAENAYRWADDDAETVLANLTALSCAIEDREQALLVAGWTHKANIAALEDIDAILGYDVTANWPV